MAAGSENEGDAIESYCGFALEINPLQMCDPLRQGLLKNIAKARPGIKLKYPCCQTTISGA
jgi:hypothetical protein